MNFQLASTEHEQGLRELLRNSPMPGWIRVAFGREPDFFQAVKVQGRFNQVLVALEGDRVLGMGCRSIKPVLIDGARTDIGYLNGLRLLPEIRRSGVLARGYAALKKLHEEKPALAYLTTIIESNREAEQLLTSGRAGLPHYLDQGRYVSFAINLRQRRRKYSPGIKVQRGDELGLEAVLSFLKEQGGRRQFFPALEEADFANGQFPGLRLGDYRVAVNGQGELLGVAAAWDQSAFKQNIVAGYALPVRMLRPAINACLALAGFRPLPDPGQQLGSLYLAFCCVREDDPAVFRALLEQFYSEQQGSGYHFLVLGLHELDPLRAVLSHFLAFRYVSRCFLVCWDDGLDFVNKLDREKVPYLELAAL